MIMANKIYYTMGINMNIEDKLKEARKQLGFSQEYVANCLGISMTALAQIERGNRDVSVKEAVEFCKIYHLSTDCILENAHNEYNKDVFTNEFETLTEDDQREILKLIRFKHELNFI